MNALAYLNVYKEHLPVRLAQLELIGATVVSYEDEPQDAALALVYYYPPTPVDLAGKVTVYDEYGKEVA